MIFIIPKEGRKGRYRQVPLSYSFYQPKEVSLESIFLTLPYLTCISDPADGGQIQVPAEI